MAITVVEPRAAAPPGYGRAYASVPVQVSRQGVLRPGSLAQWRPLVPGTDDQYTGPLFGSPDSVAPLLFPQAADERGLIEVWAPEPVRVEVVAWINGYGSTRRMLDLQFTSDAQAATDQITILQGQVAVLQAQVADLQSRVVTLEDGAESLQSQVSDLQGVVATLHVQVSRHLHEAGDWDYLAGAMVMPEDIP